MSSHPEVPNFVAREVKRPKPPPPPPRKKKLPGVTSRSSKSDGGEEDSAEANPGSQLHLHWVGECFLEDRNIVV